MTTPGPRPIGVQRIRRDGQLSIHIIRYRGLTDGQTIRISGFTFAGDDMPSHHQRQHRHVDIVLPDFAGEHSSGLILRFREPQDITALQAALATAFELLAERRAEEYETAPA